MINGFTQQYEPIKSLCNVLFTHVYDERLECKESTTGRFCCIDPMHKPDVIYRSANLLRKCYEFIFLIRIWICKNFMFFNDFSENEKNCKSY